jgi:hypothetical protein
MYAQEQDRPLNFTSVQAPINPVFYSYYIATPESGIKKRKKERKSCSSVLGRKVLSTWPEWLTRLQLDGRFNSEAPRTHLRGKGPRLTSLLFLVT